MRRTSSRAHDGKNVALTWPTNATEYLLENAIVLVPSVTWSLTSSNPPSTNGQYYFIVPSTNASTYFRLRRP
jgi:hypothetical protein